MSAKVDSVTPCPSGSFQVKITTPEVTLQNCWRKNCQGVAAKCDIMTTLPIKIQLSGNVEICLYIWDIHIEQAVILV